MPPKHLTEQEKGDRFEALLTRGQQPPWPRDIELAEKAVAENKRAVLLGEGSVLYVSAPQQAAAPAAPLGKE